MNRIFFIAAQSILCCGFLLPAEVATILEKPTEFFARNKDDYCRYLTTLGDKETPKTLSDHLSAYTEYNPLFLLDECWDEPSFDNTLFGSYCPLSRSYNPGYRKAFEDFVVQACVKKAKIDQDQPLVYTSFGSGKLGQDFIILLKILQQCPNASLVVNVIDKNYPSSDILTYKHGAESCCSRAHIANASIEIHAKWYQSKNFLIELHKVTAIAQIVRYLHNNFPSAHVVAHAFSSANEYMHSSDSHIHPDILVAADIDDVDSIESGSVRAYKQLCRFALSKKPTAQNFWLHIENKDMPEVQIATFCNASKKRRKKIQLNRIVLAQPEDGATQSFCTIL